MEKEKGNYNLLKRDRGVIKTKRKTETFPREYKGRQIRLPDSVCMCVMPHCIFTGKLFRNWFHWYVSQAAGRMFCFFSFDF